ncbi:AraC family transcriptional regulator [Paenibacillus mendelii]|uniref:AraC family transcriptional regulator N-terminal domain-containing protein n=1 Tax=Paenibacillus mendelii TaxID=206163 RepID=A0ABV6J1S6_9BACL|nr:AraC family transcriptional regulator [Paenibacillus mendelii]MCQ6562765.1 AraC family transcriptional regulator [Paenibacillus mendelii]
MSETIHQQQEELAKRITSHSDQEGVYETAIPSLFFIHRSNVTEPVHRVYKPALCLIAQGSKEIWLAQERFEYGPADYLISSMNLPVMGQIVKASSGAPYLSLRLEFTQNQILEVLNESQLQITSKENAARAMFVGPIESSLLDAVLRLVRLLEHPQDIPYLAPIYTKEILYKLLQGQYGVTLAQIAMKGSSTYHIRDAIEQIMNNFDKSLRIEELADTANMSISSFHRHFKEITAMSPIQFQKRLRLQEARHLLLSESADAADVAFRLGYESASQFSREYSRMFGFPPREDIKRLKAQFDQSIHA